MPFSVQLNIVYCFLYSLPLGKAYQENRHERLRRSSYIVNTMAAAALVRQGARASSAMVNFSLTLTVSGPKQLLRIWKFIT